MSPAVSRRKPLRFKGFDPRTASGTGRAYTHTTDQTATEEPAVDLTLWIPLTLGLGLGALALMCLFVAACDRV